MEDEAKTPVEETPESDEELDEELEEGEDDE